MTGHFLAAYHSHGSYAFWLYLWHRLHWLAIPVYTAILVITGLVKAFFSGIFKR